MRRWVNEKMSHCVNELMGEWRYDIFSATQILREINFFNFRSSLPVFRISGVSFVVKEFLQFTKDENSEPSKLSDLQFLGL